MRDRTTLKLLLPVVAALLVLSACSSDSEGASSDGGPPASCKAGDLPTLKDGKLTIGTDTPAFEPWFVDDDPSNGKGFEGAVAYAVAEELGFATSDVVWAKVPFDTATAPGAKKFDFDINQVSITPERAKVVDFSEGYYDVNQALVGYRDQPIAVVTSAADLKDKKLGAQEGTTSYDFITEVIKPTAEPFVYNDNSAAKAALDAKQIDGIVLDLPTALYVSAVEIEGTMVVGQFPNTGDEPEQFGLVLEKDSDLTDCVSAAVAALKESGKLKEIQDEWLSGTVAPEISLD